MSDACVRCAERRRRWSETYKGVPESDDEADAAAAAGGKLNGLNGHHDDQLRREQHELAKIHSGIAQVKLTVTSLTHFVSYIYFHRLSWRGVAES